MTTEEAVKLLKKRLSHITRDYTPEDAALDQLAKKAFKVDRIKRIVELKEDHPDELMGAIQEELKLGDYE